jgi:C-terminal of Roc, COR, domain/Ras of Complex, Roc, domain of DAPkinase
MDREQFKNLITRHFRSKKPEIRHAIAFRAMLRVLPLLVNYKVVGKYLPFWYWDQPDRSANLLKVLRALGRTLMVANGLVDTSYSTNQIGDNINEIANRVRLLGIAAVAKTSIHEVEAMTSLATNIVNLILVGAINPAKSILYAYDVSINIIPSLAQELEFDFGGIEIKQMDEFLCRPLWHNFDQSMKAKLKSAFDINPETREADIFLWKSLFDHFNNEMLALDPSFKVWLSWYGDRVAGKLIRRSDHIMWLSYPYEIQAQGTAAINSYIAGVIRKSQSKPLNRVRTIFIGHGEAGKTSLIRALHGEAVSEGKEEMTPGIAIREWDGAGDGLITHLWDFGGQVVAHATHQFFLRSSCLYVLVLSARAEINANEQAEYWLQHVKAFGGDAPVMIVGNKVDQISLLLDMRMLSEKYPNIKGFYQLSCTQALGGPHMPKFIDFKANLCKQLKQMKHTQVLFSIPQFALLQELQIEAKQAAFLTHRAFDEMCDRHGIKKDGELNRDWLLDILDKLGVVIHFKNLSFLDEFVLNPRWLTYGVYAVMYANTPYLSEAIIVKILADAKLADENQQLLTYDRYKCSFIAAAMQEFKLCYRLPQDYTQLIIPSLLPTGTPALLSTAGLVKSKALAYKLAFNGFVPRHVMPEMIVEQNEAIWKNLVWQNGVLLQQRTTQSLALLQVDYQARELVIFVKGLHGKEYLEVLREALKKILARLTLGYEEKIRLPSSALSRHSRNQKG